MTSVKEFRVHRDPTPDEPGQGRFVFTDAYSVFDWGRMPDRIPAKGASLCTMGAFNFELLEGAGVPTHYRGVGSDGVRLEDRDEPPRQLVIDLVDVPELPFDAGDYDYEAFHDAAGQAYLIPLEIVFRNRVPVGSSLRDRTVPTDHGLETESWPDEAVELPRPVVEFSTKFEEQDRYLSRGEADRIAGAADLGDLEALARRVNDLVTDRADTTGFTHEDGKIECLYVDGDLRVGDVVGTFDENRFAYDGQEVSKEVLRQFYKRKHPDWVDAVREAKTRANREGIADWRGLCTQAPPTLPASVIELASELYTAGTNAYTGRSWFEAPVIDEAVAAIREL